MRKPPRGLPSPVAALALGLTALTGCNAIFGIETGEPSTSGSTTTSAGGGGAGGTTGSGGSSSAGGSGGLGGTSSGGSGGAGGSGGITCGPYDGNGTIQWSDLGGINLPVATIGAGSSINAQYDVANDVTKISMGSFVEHYCSAGAGVVLTGPPVVGQVYSLVDRATYQDPVLFHQGGPNAYIETGGTPAPPGDDCSGPSELTHLYSSTAGVGTLKINTFSGVKLTFSATGVVAEPVIGPAYDGTGSLGVEILGFADCYYEN